MLTESCTTPPVPATIGATALRCVWAVDADSSYDVPAAKARKDSTRLRPRGSTGLIALRTHEGDGRVYLSDERVRELHAASLLVTEWTHLVRYHCAGERWRFWWFEFDTIGPCPVPRDRTFSVSMLDEEAETLEQILSHLRSEQSITRALACSMFQTLLLRWGLSCTGDSRRERDIRRIQAAIDQVYEQRDGTLTVDQMARLAHMSPQQFRRIFRQVTGYPPKKFYDRLRMSWAEHMLRTERKSISEVAERLGYCSVFHFSRVFSTHFGFPPSKLR